jgi:hypothetical protein
MCTRRHAGRHTHTHTHILSLSLARSLARSLSHTHSLFSRSLPHNISQGRDYGRASAIYPVASFVNHDCAPNAVRFDFFDDKDGDVEEGEAEVREEREGVWRTRVQVLNPKPETRLHARPVYAFGYGQRATCNRCNMRQRATCAH